MFSYSFFPSFFTRYKWDTSDIPMIMLHTFPKSWLPGHQEEPWEEAERTSCWVTLPLAACLTPTHPWAAILKDVWQTGNFGGHTIDRRLGSKRWARFSEEEFPFLTWKMLTPDCDVMRSGQGLKLNQGGEWCRLFREAVTACIQLANRIWSQFLIAQSSQDGEALWSLAADEDMALQNAANKRSSSKPPHKWKPVAHPGKFSYST